MARLDSWDVCAFQPTWFDVNFSPAGTGWWDRDLVPPPGTPPPPPPPKPPKPPKQTSQAGSGGGSGDLSSFCPPEWLKPWLKPWFGPETETDFALLHITGGAAIRALADGVIESFVDGKGRASVTLKADDGTRYWYAEIGTLDVLDGARVRRGEVIAHTRGDLPVAPSTMPPRMLPSQEPTSRVLPPHEGLPALPPPPRHEPAPEPAKPTQIVFVEAPLPEPLPLPPPAPPVKILVRLVPVGAEAPATRTRTAPIVTAAVSIATAAASIGAIAALLYAFSLIRPAPPPPKRKRKRRPRRKRSKRRRWYRRS